MTQASRRSALLSQGFSAACSRTALLHGSGRDRTSLSPDGFILQPL